MISTYLSDINTRLYRRGFLPLAVCCMALSWSFYASAVEPALSAQEIVDRVSVHADDYWELTRDYTFLMNILVEDYEDDGSLKKQLALVERMYHFHGRRFIKRLTVNGEPLSDEELEEQRLRESKFRERTKESIAKGDDNDLKGRMDRQAIFVADLVPRYTYELAGTDTLQGRDVYVVRFTPKPDLEAETRRDKIFNKLAGTAWIDMEQFRIVKAVGKLVDNVRIGWIAANITRVDLDYEQQEITPGIWMPRNVNAKVEGSIFFFRRLNRYTSADFYQFIKTEEAPPEIFEGVEVPTEDEDEER